jgi:hypothetical protein
VTEKQIVVLVEKLVFELLKKIVVERRGRNRMSA